jgi:hypothetical protein
VRLIDAVCILDEQERAGQIKSALARGLPICGPQEVTARKLAIVAPSPSIKDKHLEFQSWTGDIWAINGAHDYLVQEIGRAPTGFVSVDPHPAMLKHVRFPQAKTTYYLASSSAPELFDALKGFDVRIWHSKHDPGHYPAVSGGVSCVTSAPFLAYMLGYRDITIFGADSSYEDQPYAYAGPTVVSTPEQVLYLRVDGNVFKTEAGLAMQANHLCLIRDHFPVPLKFECEGLLAALLDSPIRSLDEVA